MSQKIQHRWKAFTAVAAALAVTVVVGTVIGGSSKKQDYVTTTEPTTIQSTTTASTPTTASQTTSSTYKDGSYTATGSYGSPAGREDITISLTIQNGIITATSAKTGTTDRESLEYQKRFIIGYKSQVIGRAIAEISLNRVSGSSLTPEGFNDAIDQIKSQATA